jgi:1,4-alpha-glucan branching enzyme
MVTISGEWVEFKFFRPQAGRVHLAGDFNNWRVNELPMVRDESGYWFARMHLPAGEFKFRYLADGEWYTDYAAFGVEPGRFGMDSILRVPKTSFRVLTARTPQGIAAA